MNCREKMVYSTSTGIIARVRAARSAVQSVLYCPAKVDSPEVTVFTSGVNVRGNHRSFQIGIMLKTRTVASAGRVVLGGGVMAAGDLLLEPLRQAIREWALPNAGAIGVAAFSWHYMGD